MSKPKSPLLRLVHSLDRHRNAPTYAVSMRLRLRSGESIASTRASLQAQEPGPRTFIVGTGERVDLATSGGLLPRHLFVLTELGLDGVHIRVGTLHPDRTLWVDDGSTGVLDGLGGVLALGAVTVFFEGFALEIVAEPIQEPAIPSLPGVIREFVPGEQVAFYQGAFVRPVGNVVSSITGPGGGGHAIPALVADASDNAMLTGSLLLRTREGIHELVPDISDLRRGLLIGRSRRCVLGRGFNENDGLSRVHALVTLIDDAVYAFDLASRYGLRDVSRPNHLIRSARLDDGAGCLVYGAGHLLFER